MTQLRNGARNIDDLAFLFYTGKTSQLLQKMRTEMHITIISACCFKDVENLRCLHTKNRCRVQVLNNIETITLVT